MNTALQSKTPEDAAAYNKAKQALRESTRQATPRNGAELEAYALLMRPADPIDPRLLLNNNPFGWSAADERQYQAEREARCAAARVRAQRPLARLREWVLQLAY